MTREHYYYLLGNPHYFRRIGINYTSPNPRPRVKFRLSRQTAGRTGITKSQ